MWRGMGSPKLGNGCLSGPGSSGMAGKMMTRTSVAWFRGNAEGGRQNAEWWRGAGWRKSEGNPKIEVRTRLGRVGCCVRRGGWCLSDAQGSNTVVPPHLRRGSAVEARERKADCGMRNADCGIAARLWAGGRVTGVNCGEALKGGKARVRPGQQGRRQNCWEAQSQRRFLTEGGGECVLRSPSSGCLQPGWSSCCGCSDRAWAPVSVSTSASPARPPPPARRGALPTKCRP